MLINSNWIIFYSLSTYWAVSALHSSIVFTIIFSAVFMIFDFCLSRNVPSVTHNQRKFALQDIKTKLCDLTVNLLFTKLF